MFNIDDDLDAGGLEITAAPFPAGAPLFAPISVTDQHLGVNNAWSAVDGAGVEHLLEQAYLSLNNNAVCIRYKRLRNGEHVAPELGIAPGSTADWHNPNFWKLDHFTVAVVGRNLMIRMYAHQISETTPFRKPGNGRTQPFILNNVWTPFEVGSGPLLPAYDEAMQSRQTFSDVPPGNPFHRYVEVLAAAGAISGYSDGTFRGHNNLTRNQAVKVIYEALGGE